MYRKSVPSNDIVVIFLKMYRYRYRQYFFSKVSVPISSLLLKYRVPSSACKRKVFTAGTRGLFCIGDWEAQTFCNCWRPWTFSYWQLASVDLLQLAPVNFFALATGKRGLFTTGARGLFRIGSSLQQSYSSGYNIRTDIAYHARGMQEPRSLDL